MKLRLSPSSRSMALATACCMTLAAVAARFPQRWDWTDGGRYSLSPASKTLLGSLPEPVLLKAYVSEGLPQPYGAYARYVKELLEEYRLAGKTRVKVETIDPASSEKARSQAVADGAAPIQFNQVADDKFQVREGFIGVALRYGEKKASVPFVQDMDNLEYELSTHIKRLAAGSKKTLGLVTGHGEPMPSQFKEGPGARLSDLFTLRTVDLSTAAAVKLDALFLIAPQTALSGPEAAALDRAMAEGTPIALFISRRAMSLGNFFSQERPTGLEAFLGHYGLKLGADYAQDALCQRISFQSTLGGITVANVINYPPLILSNRLNKTHILTAPMNVLSFPFAQPVEISTAPLGSLKATVLANTSPKSWVTPGLSVLQPLSLPPPGDSILPGPFPLAVILEGKAPSFSDPKKEIPVRLFLAGTAHFADGHLPGAKDNGLFLANLAEWMTQEAGFLAIPSKGSPYRPLERTGPAARRAVKTLGLFFLPAGIIAWGLLRWRRRERLRPAVARAWRENTSPS